MAQNRKKGAKPRKKPVVETKRSSGRTPGQAKPDSAVQLVYSKTGLESVTVEPSGLSAPDRTFAADFAFFKATQEGDYRIVFVQTEPFGDRPRSALSVRMSDSNFKQLASHKDFIETLHAGHGGDSEEERQRVESMIEAAASLAPEKCYTERATLARMSILGGDAEIDFYFISPNRYQDAKARQDTSRLVTPIASVSVPAKLLSIVLHRIADLNNG